MRATGDPGSAFLRTAAPAGASCRVVFGCVCCVLASLLRFGCVLLLCMISPFPPSVVVEALLSFRFEGKLLGQGLAQKHLGRARAGDYNSTIPTRVWSDQEQRKTTCTVVGPVPYGIRAGSSWSTENMSPTNAACNIYSGVTRLV